MHDKQALIGNILARLTLEQKVGQCFVLGMMGTMATPLLRRRVREFCPAGIRSGHGIRNKTVLHDPYATGLDLHHKVARAPAGNSKDFLVGLPSPHISNEEFCEVLNSMKREALNNGAGLPLHITLDMEGSMSADYCRGGIHTFPHPMGLVKTGDPQLARDVAWAVARQVTAVGYDWIHSPVLDVNTNPMNPEISTRSYAEDPDEAAVFALAALDGFREGGLIATGKHFPGRGACGEDAHHGLPVIDLPEAELRRHLIPFKALVDAGLPAVMSAHTAYPAYDRSGRAATLSPRIITDILKGEMGFQGAVTTDAICMGGIVARFQVWEACVEALKAGCDLVLLRDEGPLVEEVIPAVIEAVRCGELPEERIDDAVRRTLGVKMDYGLFETGGLRPVDCASDGIRDPRVTEIELDAARRCVHVMRDADGLLPIATSKRILLVEQVAPLHLGINDMRCHPGLLWEKMFAIREDVGMVEVTMHFDENDRRRVHDRLNEADIVVATNYYFRRTDLADDFVAGLTGLGKPLVVVTNNPYPLTVNDEFGTVVLTYGVGPESLAAVAEMLLKERT